MADEMDAVAWEARTLMRASRSGVLATVVDGQPFASLVTPACTPDLSILLLLSDLSEHTRHLRAEPRCSILVTGIADGPNPQTAPRLTVTGVAERMTDPALKARFVAVHPYAAMYADFGDFAIWRVQPAGGLFVGGFARAVRLRAVALRPESAALTAIAAASADIIDHFNRNHPYALAAIARLPGSWRMIGVDVDGFDLISDDQVIRVSWARPISDDDGARSELIRLARDARAAGAA